MKGFLDNTDGEISRREFLQLSCAGILSLFLTPGFSRLDFNENQNGIPSSLPIGRVLENKVTLYDRPSFSGKFLKMYWRDLLLPITAITVGDKEPVHNRVWYQLSEEGYVHSGSIQPVKLNLNDVLQNIPEKGQLAEVTVPYTDAIWNPKFPSAVAYRLYYNTTHWIVDVKQDHEGKFWYLIPDDQFPFSYFVDATHLRPITAEELSPLSANVPPEEKRLEIQLKNQVVVAFEDDRPIFMTRVATGARFSDGDYRTPVGTYITNRKRPSRHMADGGLAAPKTYDLPGVPWVCYLTRSGISFHGTYWHNDFGKPRSHGCINCLSPAARWLYRWTSPTVPVDRFYWKEDNGTKVEVLYEHREN